MSRGLAGTLKIQHKVVGEIGRIRGASGLAISPFGEQAGQGSFHNALTAKRLCPSKYTCFEADLGYARDYAPAIGFFRHGAFAMTLI